MTLRDRVKGLRPRPSSPRTGNLPDPAQPPERRGEWEQAALTNVEITELIKRQLRTDTRPWQK